MRVKVEVEREELFDLERGHFTRMRIRGAEDYFGLEPGEKRELFLVTADEIGNGVERARTLLIKHARKYQNDDGAPGVLASSWGWRTIAEILRKVADKLKGETNEEK